MGIAGFNREEATSPVLVLSDILEVSGDDSDGSRVATSGAVTVVGGFCVLAIFCSENVCSS